MTYFFRPGIVGLLLFQLIVFNIGYNNATYWKNGIPVSLGKGQANAIFIADK